MPVRFVIGRAGSGKTYHCLAAIRDQLRKDPIDGPKLICLVPEQAALQTERAIIAPPDIPGAHRAEVLSFQRMAYRVLEHLGGAGTRAISETARIMVLRHLLSKHAGQLQYYRRVNQHSGFMDQLNTAIREFMQEAIEPRDLGNIAESAGSDDARRAKLHDLSVIYDAYLAFLGTSFLDPSLSLKNARERLHRCDWLHGAHVWVDGFASFMKQELLTLIELARLADHCEMTLLADPGLIDEGSTSSLRFASQRLFGRTVRTYRDIARALSEQGIAIEEPVILVDSEPPRFRGRAMLTTIERNLFTPSRVTSRGEPVAGARGSDGKPLPDGRGSDQSYGPQSGPYATNGSQSEIAVVELPSRRVEVDYAVAQVRDWVQTCGYRYRDIAIIARDLTPYHDLLSAALSSRDVPYFIDRRRSTAHHPLVELLRAVANLIADDLSLESVRLLLKTGLLPLSSEEADELENYLLAHAIQGMAMWAGEWTFENESLLPREQKEPTPETRALVVRMNVVRGRLLEWFDPWFKRFNEARSATGAAWSDLMIRWLNALQAPQRLDEWSRAANENGDLETAVLHEQAWRSVIEFLEDLAFVFAETQLTIQQLAAVLDAGLSKLTLALVPPTIDQVLVGSIDRSRHPDMKAVVLIGFNDGVFPQPSSESSILNDDDRSAFEAAGVHVAPTSKDRILDEALLLYIAVTRASESLVITYALSDEKAKAIRPSPYLEALRDACPELTVVSVPEPIGCGAAWDVLTLGDLSARLNMELRKSASKSQAEQPQETLWRAIYQGAIHRLGADPRTAHTLTALADRPRARLSPNSVVRLTTGGLRASVSQLETFAACPFKYFADYGLRLKERQVAKLEPADAGTVQHAVLDEFVREFCNARRSLASMSETDASARLREACLSVGRKLPTDGMVMNPRHIYLLRRASENLARAIEAQRRVAQAGRYQPRAVELPFGYGNELGLPELRISTPKGRVVELRGYIDRVDLTSDDGEEVLATVIDYKRTADKRLHYSEVFHGLTLQLLGYLLVVSECGSKLTNRRITPAAALYISLSPTYEVIKGRTELPDAPAPLAGSYLLRGLIRADRYDFLEQSGSSSGWSKFFSAYRKVDGSLGNLDRSDAYTDADFQLLLEHTRRKLGELADGILDGRVEVSPFRHGMSSPCTFCRFKAVCGFEIGLHDLRYLDQIKRAEIFKRMTDDS